MKSDVISDEEFSAVMENPPDPKPVVAFVKDETLFETGRFERGVSYATEHSLDAENQNMIWVYDKYGKKDLYFRERFELGFDE